jgi:hypothetical protein
MSRIWGTALDHVIAIQVVLADASVVRASATENPDVFFAIRGAAASFGIVTEFTVCTPCCAQRGGQIFIFLRRGFFYFYSSNIQELAESYSDPHLSRKLYTHVTLCGARMIISGCISGRRISSML